MSLKNILIYYYSRPPPTYKCRMTTYKYRMTTYECRMTTYEYRMPTYECRMTTYKHKITTCSARSRSLSLFLDSLSLFSGPPNFRVIGDLLKNFWTIIQEYPELPLPTFRPNQTSQEKARVIIPPSRPVQTSFHYSGTNFPLKWESGKENRIIYQRSKQEKARTTSLESKRQLPTVGGREKRAAL